MPRMRASTIGRRPLPKGAPRGGGAPSIPERDYFGEMNAFQADIAGQQPGPLSKGYGGFGALDTMSQIKMNSYLNTLPVGGERERAMNALGYNNAGNPYTPQVGKGVNQFHRQNARENAETGAYSSPGIYQHQDASGNYIGITNVGAGGQAQYTPFDINRGPDARAVGGGKMLPRPVHTQIGNPGARKAGQMRGRDEGRPVIGKPGMGAGGGGGGFGGPGKGGGKGTFKPAGFPQPTGGAGFAGKPGAFPQMPPQAPGFLPLTPGYEASYRGANDQLAAAEGAYAASGSQLPAQIGLERARLGTDQDVATDRLKEQLAARGIFTPFGADHTARDPRMATSPAGGGVGEALYNRQVATPFGRSYQDLAAAAESAYRDRAMEYGGAQLGFNQQMLDALLQRGEDAYSAMPLSLPIGGYELPQMAGPSFSAKPGGAGKQRSRGGKKSNRRK